MIILKSDAELKIMRHAGIINAKAHEMMHKYVKPGVSTFELDQIVKDVILSENAIPAFMGYMGYPANICASVNSQVVHGIPSKKVILSEGDIVGIDIGVVYNGYCSDAANTYPVGKISHEADKLIRVTRECFFQGIKYATQEHRLLDIGHAIQKYVEDNGFSVVRDMVGHGIGTNMHEDPQVPNYGPPNRGVRLKKGMTIAIEPMVNVGTYEIKTLDDGWTVVTKDGKLSAHFEHTVAITDSEPILLTIL